MEKTTLAEAYRRRESIDEAGQAIYCKGRTTGITRRIVFHARQPGGVWYNLWLVSGDEVSLVAMHQEAEVYIGEMPTAYPRIVPQDRSVSTLT